MFPLFLNENENKKLTLWLQWLPNQLSAVMDLMVTIYETHLAPKEGVTIVNGHEDLIASHRKQVEPMMELVRDQRQKLAREVERWCQERGV